VPLPLPFCIALCAAAFALHAAVFALLCCSIFSWCDGICPLFCSICSLCCGICPLCFGICLLWQHLLFVPHGLSLCCSICSVIVLQHCALSLLHGCLFVLQHLQHCCAMAFAMLQIDLQCCKSIHNVENHAMAFCATFWGIMQHSRALCNILGCCATFQDIVQHSGDVVQHSRDIAQPSGALRNLLGHCATFRGVAQHSGTLHNIPGLCTSKGEGGLCIRKWGFTHQERGVYASGKGGCVSEKGHHVSCTVLASTSGHTLA